MVQLLPSKRFISIWFVVERRVVVVIKKDERNSSVDFSQIGAVQKRFYSHPSFLPASFSSVESINKKKKKKKNKKKEME